MGYGAGQYQNNFTPIQQSRASEASLMQKVSYMLCSALLVTAACAYFGQSLSPDLWLPFAIGTFVCVIGINFARSNPALGAFLLYLLSAFEGLMIGPLLSAITTHLPGGGLMVGEAFGLTAIIVGGIGSYVWISNADFGYLGKMLFYALIGVIIISIISMFWHTLAAMPGFELGISLAIVAIFVGFTLYDFSNIKLRYGPQDYVVATVALYLDFLNLFMAILRILMILGGGGSSRRN
jgi:FtsH-binding integral membrane protein